MVKQVKGNQMWVELLEPVHNADGLCYFDGRELRGVKVNTAEGNRLTCNERLNVKPGTLLYRNYDHEFVTRLAKGTSVRKIKVKVDVYAEDARLVLVATDENGVSVMVRSDETFEVATNPVQMERVVGQLRKSGDTEYDCCEVEYHDETVLFIPSSVVNGYRRHCMCLEPGTGGATGEMDAGAFEPGCEVYRECRLAAERGEPSRDGVLSGAWRGDG